MQSIESAADSLKQGLYIVATPLGNLEDVTFRAVRILKECGIIFSEDTRKTSILLKHYGIQTEQKSYRIHKIHEDTQKVLTFLKTGKSAAFCTDAGTPGISDPGSHLVRIVREELPELPVFPIPGPSAMAAAFSVSGFQANPSVFTGFLSPKPGRRKNNLLEYENFPGCIVIYESVHRVKKLCLDLFEIFPERDIFIAREITKIYEEYLFFHAGSIEERMQKLEGLTEKGEFTLIVGPHRKKKE